jgi:hypothetical protein
MDQPDLPLAQLGAQMGEPFLRRDGVIDLRFLDQRADPVGLPPLRDRIAQVAHDLPDPRRGQQRGLHRLPPRRFFVQHADVHVAVLRKAQRAGDRRRRHHQHIRRLPLGAQPHALGHAEPVLFVDDGKAQVGEGDVVLEHRVGAHENLDVARRQRAQFRRPLRPLVGARQDLDHDARLLGHRFEVGVMLPARIEVGAIITPCPPASTAISSAINATSVLPAPTSPCRRRLIRVAAAMSASISDRAKLRTRG